MNWCEFVNSQTCNAVVKARVYVPLIIKSQKFYLQVVDYLVSTSEVIICLYYAALLSTEDSTLHLIQLTHLDKAFAVNCKQ